MAGCSCPAGHRTPSCSATGSIATAGCAAAGCAAGSGCGTGSLSLERFDRDTTGALLRASGGLAGRLAGALLWVGVAFVSGFAAQVLGKQGGFTLCGSPGVANTIPEASGGAMSSHAVCPLLRRKLYNIPSYRHFPFCTTISTCIGGDKPHVGDVVGGVGGRCGR
ncbi:hypothetical protein LC603019_01012 [Lawsonella clevelandensis]|uniref:Uncharacterized protein n=1 Tax=Lawsonella clevelandensis TaxID=1528099 RepID=A0A5E3ZY59_9ACTN|nr:hypothetical protein LC603019_01012 [Lawsonella clevelandensis]